MSEEKAANVVEALSRVIRDLPGIGKTGKASAAQGGYAFRGIEAITREASQLFARHGIVFAPRMTDWHERVDLIVNGKPWTDERVEVMYRVYGPGGKADFIDVGPIPAIGRDNADKGANKCLSAAYKYALLQTLCISDAADDTDGQTPVADDVPTRPSDRDGVRPSPLASDAQKKKIGYELRRLGGEPPVSVYEAGYPSLDVNALSKTQASQVIDLLCAEPDPPPNERRSSMRENPAAEDDGPHPASGDADTAAASESAGAPLQSGPDSGVPATPYDDMKGPELVQACRDAGLKASGTRAEMIQRLCDEEAAPEAPSSADDERPF